MPNTTTAIKGSSRCLIHHQIVGRAKEDAVVLTPRIDLVDICTFIPEVELHVLPGQGASKTWPLMIARCSPDFSYPVLRQLQLEQQLVMGFIRV